MHDAEYVCGCDGAHTHGGCCGGACGCGRNQKLTVVAVGKCPACASGILEAESDRSPSVCNACGFTEGSRVA